MIWHWYLLLGSSKQDTLEKAKLWSKLNLLLVLFGVLIPHSLANGTVLQSQPHWTHHRTGQLRHQPQFISHHLQPFAHGDISWIAASGNAIVGKFQKVLQDQRKLVMALKSFSFWILSREWKTTLSTSDLPSLKPNSLHLKVKAGPQRGKMFFSRYPFSGVNSLSISGRVNKKL